MSVPRIKVRKVIDFFFSVKCLSNSEIMKKGNQLITAHNRQVDKKQISENKLRTLDSIKQLELWIDLKKSILQKYRETETEAVMRSKFGEGQNYRYASLKLNMSVSRYYYMLNHVYRIIYQELSYHGLLLIGKSYIKTLLNYMKERIHEIVVEYATGEKAKYPVNSFMEKDDAIIIMTQNAKFLIKFRSMEE